MPDYGGFFMKMKSLLLIASFLFSINVNAVDLKYGVARDQNKRDYQEDRDVQVSIRTRHSKKIGSFFAVYDGHGGDKVSILLQKNLHFYFAQQLRRGKNEKEAFEYAFLKAERVALRKFSDGSTAVVAYVDSNDVLHCATTGDSRLVLDFNFATRDHKPDRVDEKRRIEQAGGKVVIHEGDVPRVNGLAVSRSIGDRDLKKGFEEQIIADPEYARYQLTENNQFAIMASDGLWDVVANEQARTFVKNALQKNQSLDEIAKNLKNEAIKRGSGDNITIIIVQFDWSKQ